jgi:hypothetical protein
MVGANLVFALCLPTEEGEHKVHPYFSGEHKVRPYAVACPSSAGAPIKLRLAEHVAIMISNVITYGAASNK